jgi:hypothetical protein
VLVYSCGISTITMSADLPFPTSESSTVGSKLREIFLCSSKLLVISQLEEVI